MTRAAASGCPTICRRSRRPIGEAPPLSLGRLGDTLARLAEQGPDDFYKGEIAQAIVADIRAGGGVLSAADLAQCRARIVPSLEIPYRGYSLHAARGLTAAPTLADVLDRLSSKRFQQAPGRGLFRSADRRAAAGLSRAARRSGRHQAARRKLHDAHHRDRPRRRHRGADDDAAVELRQPLRAAADRHPDEQRHHVVRPAAGPAEFDGPRQAGADQYVPARRGARRPAAFRGRRLGRPPHPGRGRAAGELYRRFRDDAGTGGAPAAHRCQRRDRHRDRPSPARAGARPADWRGPAPSSSSTRSGRRNSPARTSCCAARTGSITASPT